MTSTIFRNTSLMVALFATAGAGAPAQTQGRVVHVTAERFTFTPSRIVVNPGETIEFRLTSDDTAHGFRINGTDVNAVIPKRGMPETTVTLTAPATPGHYVIECTRMCGAGHNFMRGELVVRDEAKGARKR
jgi:cytochrome c oxidase subunit II